MCQDLYSEKAPCAPGWGGGGGGSHINGMGMPIGEFKLNQ